MGCSRWPGGTGVGQRRRTRGPSQPVLEGGVARDALGSFGTNCEDEAVPRLDAHALTRTKFLAAGGSRLPQLSVHEDEAAIANFTHRAWDQLCADCDRPVADLHRLADGESPYGSERDRDADH